MTLLNGFSNCSHGDMWVGVCAESAVNWHYSPIQSVFLSYGLRSDANDYFTVNFPEYYNFLEYYKLSFVRGGSKLFMLICDNEELFISMGAEQNSEILEVVGQNNLGVFSHKAH